MGMSRVRFFIKTGLSFTTISKLRAELGLARLVKARFGKVLVPDQV
jgi:hypothetical protein